jgi:hypothetical protein
MSTTETSPTINAVDIQAVAGLAAKIQDSPEVASTTWKAEVTWEQGFRSTASIRDFAPIGSDEPAALGGTDTAPEPSSRRQAPQRMSIINQAHLLHPETSLESRRRDERIDE